MKNLAIIGSTGSVGTQALQVVDNLKSELNVVALVNNRNLELLEQQIERYQPRYYYNSSSPSEASIGSAQPLTPDKIVQLKEVDVVVVASSHSGSLRIILNSLNAGKRVALAHKEDFIMAGELVMDTAREHNAELIPMDSEPSAIWQCLEGEQRSPASVTLTASGGAFRDREWHTLKDVKPSAALKNPNWKMGPKITIDSATLVNKAFEVLETHLLFGIPYSRINVTLHRQSYVHSFVTFVDGSCKAQISPPDMRYPIQYALLYPQRYPANPALTDWDVNRLPDLTFEPLRHGRYPCFDLVLEYARKGASYPAVLAAADAAAVELFLTEKIEFTTILNVLQQAVKSHSPVANPGLEQIESIYADTYASCLKHYGA